MKKLLQSLIVFPAFLLTAHTVFAQEGGYSSAKFSHPNNVEKTGEVGVGVQVGNISGITADYWVAPDRSVNALIAAENGNAVVGLSHLWIFKGALSQVARARYANYFAPYIGAGAIAAIGSNPDYLARNAGNTAIAAQIPLGMQFLPNLQRFSVFAEVAPSVEVYPQGYGFLTADLGARFYF